MPTSPRFPLPTQEQPDRCEYLVCAPAVPETEARFGDSFVAPCCHCDCKVVWRWFTPKIPKRICLDCFMRMPDKDTCNALGCR